MRTKRPNPTTRQVAHGALLSLALVAALGSAATAAPAVSPVGLNKVLQSLDVDADTPVTIGGPLSATADLGDVDPTDTGEITFSLYGPDDATCANDPVFVTDPPIATTGPNDAYGPATFTPTAVGTYQWVAAYVGDNEETASTDCGDDPAVVEQAQPELTTEASGNTPLGGDVTDTATLSGAYQPTGTITFNLYGPGDDVCEAAPVETSSVTVNPLQTEYTSDPFEPTVVGDYRWRADYSGDDNNAAAGTACNDPLEQFTVLTTPDLATAVADPEVDLGDAVSDTATLTGSTEDATGSITFTLYGPNDEDCSTDPVFTSDAISVDGDGTYPSGPFTPEAAGTYRWIASYTGDDNNAGVTTQCGDENETVIVRGDLATPELRTYASRDTFVGKRVFDTAILTGGDNPTGTITFNLYGPGDATCSRTPVFTSVVQVDGNDTYKSGDFRPRVPGTYQWVAEYSGDDNNEGVVTACDDPAEQVVVKKKKPYGGIPRP